MKKIKLTKNKWAIVDDDMFEELNAMKWYAHRASRREGKKFYAARRKRKTNAFTTMHRYIMKAKKGQTVDHKNRNSLDNRIENLRFCNRSQNCFNSLRKIGKFKGVSKCKNGFNAEITVYGKRIYIGRYDSARDAAIAYDAATHVFHKKFAKPNFKQKSP